MVLETHPVRHGALGPHLSWFAIVVVVVVAGCDAAPDSRYATPEATIATVLRAYDRDETSQEDIRSQLAAGERFELGDPTSFHGAFLDYRGTVDEGLTGYVFGFVASGKDDLVVETSGERAYAYPKPSDRSQRVVMLRNQRRWLISLAESVPVPVQTALRAEHTRAREELVRSLH